MVEDSSICKFKWKMVALLSFFWEFEEFNHNMGLKLVPIKKKKKKTMALKLVTYSLLHG